MIYRGHPRLNIGNIYMYVYICIYIYELYTYYIVYNYGQAVRICLFKIYWLDVDVKHGCMIQLRNHSKSNLEYDKTIPTPTLRIVPHGLQFLH